MLKYIAWLKVMLDFDNSKKAKEFMENENRLKSRLKCVIWGDPADVNFERVPWIRIAGLPLYLWSDRNFYAILDRFGRNISPFFYIQHSVDLSHA